MKRHIWVWCGALLTGCASYPAPTEHLASAMAEVRAAQELSAGSRVPQAELQLKLAEDEIAQAKAFINEGKTEKADYMTLRAYNDAALALALSRENAARARAERAAAQASKSPTPSSAQ